MTLFQAFGQFAGQAAVAAAAGAWEVVTPTSIANTGGSASINSSGSITMTSNTVLNVNGVFSATYKDYAAIFTGTCTSSTLQTGRLRAAGSDASGSNYSVRDFNAQNTTLDTRVFLRDLARLVSVSTTPAICVVYFYQPFLATSTSIRTVGGNAASASVPETNEYSIYHSLGTSYDGFSWISANAVTGTMTVIGKKN